MQASNHQYILFKKFGTNKYKWSGDIIILVHDIFVTLYE